MESQSRLALFSQGQVIGATFLGGPLAGSILMARNYRRLGMPKHASTALLIGGLSTILLFAIGILLTDETLRPVAGLGGLFGMIQWYSVSQRREYEQNLEEGGRKESTAAAVGIGFACMVGLFLFLFAIAVMVPGIFPNIE